VSIIESTPRTPTWVVATIAGAFGLFYAYAVWNALAFVIASSGQGLNALGWALLLFAVVFPILVFAGGFALAWRRRPWEFALVLLTGLGLVAVFWLNVLAYSFVGGDSLVS
jgi:hypothetical protein